MHATQVQRVQCINAKHVHDKSEVRTQQRITRMCKRVLDRSPTHEYNPERENAIQHANIGDRATRLQPISLLQAEPWHIDN